MNDKVFVSAASGQFVKCREELTKDLTGVGLRPIVQEHFTQHDGTLLDKLEKLVADSDRVIIIVGDTYGAEPPPAARPAGRDRRSYTQWEYLFALGERLDGSKARPKRMFLYFADDDYLAANPVRQGDEEKSLQRAFADQIRETNRDRGKFGSYHELCRLVLKDGFPLPDRSQRPKNLPFAPLGTLFKGRDAFLDDLRRRLTGPEAGPRAIVPAQAVHGLGGVGKTRAAIEYAWKFADEYEALLFLSAPSPAELRVNLAELVGVLKIDTAETAVDARLNQVLDWLNAHPGWLLIIDNVDTEDAAAQVHRHLPRLTMGHILITSRISKWPPGVRLIGLDVLAEPDAVAYLIERTDNHRIKTPDDRAVAAAIARELGYLSLGLEQAGAYIGRKGLSLVDYRKRWESNRAAVLAWHDPRLMDYPVSVAITWATTFDQLNASERALLGVLSWLAPDPIPLFLFESPTLAAAIPEPRDVLADLARFSLVKFATEENSEVVTVHRLVQEITRSRASEGEEIATLPIALNAVNDLAVEQPWDVRNWPIWTPLTPHAGAVAEHADAAGISEPTGRLLGDLALHVKSRAQFAEAEPMARRAVAISERSLGPDHPDLASTLNNLAELLRQTNRMAEAEPLVRRALAISERSLGPDHPVVAIRLNNLVELLRHTNRMAEAEPMARRAVAIGERSLGPDHPDLASTLNNLAELLRQTNRMAEAEPMYRQALAISEPSLGPDHPVVATTLDNLAKLLRQTNRAAEAEPMFRRALAITERSLGPDHPVVATRLNNLAKLLRQTNRAAEAEPMYRRMVSILLKFQRHSGHEHPNFQTCRANYVIYLQNLGLTPEQIEAAFDDLSRELSSDGS